MELVDLTGIWRDGEFYKVSSVNQCRGCVFWKDESDKHGKQCYDRLECDDAKRYIYIDTDQDSVVNYIAARLTTEEDD